MKKFDIHKRMTMKVVSILFVLAAIITVLFLYPNWGAPQRNSVNFKGTVVEIDTPMLRKGSIVKNSKLYDNLGMEYDLTDLSGLKVIHSVPDINTKVCSKQTIILNQASSKYPDVTFINLSQNITDELNDFVQRNNIGKVIPSNDITFSEENGLYSSTINKNVRAILILDKDNEVKYIEYAKDLSNELNLDKMLNELSKLSK